MAAHSTRLSKILDELRREELNKFRWHLNQHVLKGYPPIPKGRLENADIQDVVDLMVQHYSDVAVKITEEILKKLNRNELVEDLQAAVDTKKKKKYRNHAALQREASLNKLMETIEKAEPFFIHCIRSNAEKASSQPDSFLPNAQKGNGYLSSCPTLEKTRAMHFDDELVLQQIKYTGLLETVRIQKSGYSSKYTFQEFVEKFRVLLPKGATAAPGEITELLQKMGLDQTTYLIGKTKVFLKEKDSQRLQDILNKEVMRHIITLQRWFRSCLIRIHFLDKKDAAKIIQRGWRDYYDVNRSRAATVIQAAWRTSLKRSEYLSQPGRGEGAAESHPRRQSVEKRGLTRQRVVEHSPSRAQSEPVNGEDPDSGQPRERRGSPPPLNRPLSLPLDAEAGRKDEEDPHHYSSLQRYTHAEDMRDKAARWKERLSEGEPTDDSSPEPPRPRSKQAERLQRRGKSLSVDELAKLSSSGSDSSPSTAQDDSVPGSLHFGVHVCVLTSQANPVPKVLEMMLLHVEMNGLYTEGIYCKSGSTCRARELHQILETDPDEVSLENYPIHTITGLVKRWLRELPDPLMTFTLYNDFLHCVELPDKSERLRAVYQKLDELPSANFNTLDRLIFHLVRVAKEEEHNGMSANSLAIVFAPCVLRTPHADDPFLGMKDVGKTTMCVEILIKEQFRRYTEKLQNIQELEYAEALALNQLRLRRQNTIIEKPSQLDVPGHTDSDSEAEKSLIERIKSIKEENPGESVSPPASHGLLVCPVGPGMTITPAGPSTQPATSSNHPASCRSRPVLMEEIDAFRVKLSHEDTVSLAPSTAEPINLEDGHYATLRADLESDAQDLEAESWSVAVDQSYLKALNKETTKRQDVIYELIQTEMHHVRTLKILLHVYKYELTESQLLEEARLERLFPRVEALLVLHQHLLCSLKQRRQQALEQEDSTTNYHITQLGDILISQFSGELGERMMDSYSVFCSHHSDAISLYREHMQNNKKLQNLAKKIGQMSIVRRLGVPDCFLLVTQRITKYPVLLERIIQNTEADSDEHASLVQALALIKDTLRQANGQVSEYQKASWLRDIALRLEPKSQGRLKDGRLFRREDLQQGARTLLHQATVTWKAASGRLNDIHAVLLSDVLLLLQEKDQKLVFAAVDNKPSVISLQRMIVREVAHEDKAMFLICASSTLPEMYEIHSSSRQGRDTWVDLIRQAVDNCPEGEEELYGELEARAARLKDFQERLMERDAQIVQSLTEKLQIFAGFAEAMTGLEAPPSRLLLRGDASDLQQGETLLKGAITEVENLQNMLLWGMRDSNPPQEESQGAEGALRRAETFGGFDSNPAVTPEDDEDGEVDERPASGDGRPLEGAHRSSSDPQLQELDIFLESLQNMLLWGMRDSNPPQEESQGAEGALRRAETFGGFDSNPAVTPEDDEDGEVDERPASGDGRPLEGAHRSSSDPQLQELDISEGLEQSADDETLVSNVNPASFNPFPDAEFFDRVLLLSHRLYSLQAFVSQQDSQMELQRASLSDRDRPSRHRGNVLLEQEKQRNLEKQREEMATFHKLQAQHRQEQQRWEKERERQRVQAEGLEARLLQREDQCHGLERRLAEEREELDGQRETYQQDLVRLREAMQSVEREKERERQSEDQMWLAEEREELDGQRETYQQDLVRLREAMQSVEREKERLDMQQRFKKPKTVSSASNRLRHFREEDNAPYHPVSYSQSLRVDVRGSGGDLIMSPKPNIRPSLSPILDASTSAISEEPPMVPPRRESISPQPVKAEVPIHLISTTNQAHKPGAVQQQIPTKQAALSKGKDKGSKYKGSHQRTHSAASIDMTQMSPIRATGKEGGSLRAMRAASPHRLIPPSGHFYPPGCVISNVRYSQSFMTHRRGSDDSPPEPPPFPKDVLKTDKERVIFL